MPSRNPPSSDPPDFGEEEPTVIDGTPLASEFETPQTMPRCQECGAIVFFDDFDPYSLHLGFPRDACVRGKDGSWWWCANYSKEKGKASFLVSR